MEEKREFLFSEDNYKYVGLEINEENLFSRGISKRIGIEKNEAIDLLTKKNDLNSLELCDNLNLHYNIQLFLVQIDHLSAYRVTGVCQKRKKILIELDTVKRLLAEIFYRIEAAVEKENYINLFCSPDLIQIDGRLPLGKITCFKIVVILFYGLDEVIYDNKNFLLMHVSAAVKYYYLLHL